VDQVSDGPTQSPLDIVVFLKCHSRLAGSRSIPLEFLTNRISLR
jgi:hypothetical protein